MRFQIVLIAYPPATKCEVLICKAKTCKLELRVKNNHEQNAIK